MFLSLWVSYHRGNGKSTAVSFFSVFFSCNWCRFIPPLKKRGFSLLYYDKDEELILRFRDDCERSDPRKQYEMLFRDGDEVSMIGLKMIILQAKEISYTSLLNLNNLIIQVDTSDGSPSAHDEGENDSEDAEGNKAAEGNGVGAGSRIDDTAQIRTEESCEDELGAAETEVR